MSGFDVSKDACFVGLGHTALCYYRIMLPARQLGADWCGVVGTPPSLRWATGIVQNESKMPVLGEYKVVVLQQVAGSGWLELIQMLQDRGVKVVYEIDDYVHGIKHMPDEHDYHHHFDNAYVSKMEACMKACDALIASTDWIAGNYSHFNPQTFVCRNGIDHKRYALGEPKRETVNIGWAGGTGHKKVVIPWFQQAAQVMRAREQTCFVSIGQNFALAFERWFGQERALAVPFAAIEQYPGAMTLLDIALAPAGAGGFFWGKSDLRWLEAGALGTPIIADPTVYHEIEDGVTGYKTREPKQVAERLLHLVDDEQHRKEIGKQAKEFVLDNRTIRHMAPQWERALAEIVEGP